ncbi:MAG: hypothetical protein B6247_07765 [Candidatus Parabeggiatoa sp. nov. 2]|nr:MAG: hypothetical protein B6247_07765 [Beggiatoa sp. 4572_84]
MLHKLGENSIIKRAKLLLQLGEQINPLLDNGLFFMNYRDNTIVIRCASNLIYSKWRFRTRFLQEKLSAALGRNIQVELKVRPDSHYQR